MPMSDEERRAKAAERERERRARIRAEKIANGTYQGQKTPRISRTERLAEVNEELQLPDHVLTTLDKRQLYLAYLEKGLRRSQASEKAGVSYSTVKYWRKTDEDFRKREADVEESFLDNVEDVVRQLAQMNDLKAALTILERKRPEVWAPKQKVEHEVTLQFSGSLEERMERIATLMAAAKTPELEPVIWDAEVVDDPALP